MDSPIPRHTPDKPPWMAIADRLTADRQRLVQFLISRRREVQESLAQLESWAENLVQKFQVARLELRRREYEIVTRADELDRRENLLRALEEKLSDRLYQWQVLQDELRIQEQNFSDRLARLEASIDLGVKQLSSQLKDWNRLKADIVGRTEQAWKLAQELGEQEGRVTTLRDELEYREKLLGEKSQEIARREARTQAQRRLLARRFREEWRRLRQEGETSLPAHKTPANLAPILDQLEELQASHDHLKQLLENLNGLLDRLQTQQNSYKKSEAESGWQVSQSTFGAELHNETNCGEGSHKNPWQELAEDLSRRYELACEEIRSLQAEKEQIAEKYREAAAKIERLNENRQHSAWGTSDSAWDWQVQKQQLLAALEAEDSSSFQEGKPDAEAEIARLRRELAQAETLLAQKDQEIATLQRLLEEQSTRVGNLAVGAAALEELIAQDAIIQEERENARRLREEWEQKLRQAEVELSLERAKLARERAELEERARQLEEWARQLQQQAAPVSQSPGNTPGSAKSLRRKWFGQ